MLETANASLSMLQGVLERVAPDALLVEPFLMRRIIRLDQRLTGLGVNVPHRRMYAIRSSALLAFVDRADLGLEATRSLPTITVLLSTPADDLLQGLSEEALLRQYWRMLFHARIHAQLQERVPEAERPAFAEERWRAIGSTQYEEIRDVLLHDEYLFPNADPWDVYEEFVSLYAELLHFAPNDRYIYFPAIRDFAEVDALISRDTTHQMLYEATRLVEPEGVDSGPLTAEASRQAGAAAPPPPALMKKRRARAERAEKVGNRVRAAVYWELVARDSPPEEQETLHAAAVAQLHELADRLGRYLEFSEEQNHDLRDTLETLLGKACDNIWSSEGRFLFDLQRVCLEYESEVQHVDLLRWLTSFGGEPLRSQAPLLREILVVKNLHAAKRRLAGATLAAEYNSRVREVVATAVEQAEEQLRNRVRPHIVQAFDEVGLDAADLPERVARKKLAEEMLDRLVEHGFLNTGSLRDSLSRGDLKLPDVSGWKELFWGDQLLRADRKLSQALPGIYRRAPAYIRWSQQISSLFFGTPWGRQATLYFFLPFGLAFLLVEFLKHTAHLIVGLYEAGAVGGLAETSAAEAQVEAAAKHADFDWRYLAVEAGLGLFFAVLIHSPRTRKLCWKLLVQLGRLLHRLLIDLPWKVLHLPWVQALLHSPAYAAVRNYLLKPAAFTLFVQILLWPIFGRLSWNWVAHVMMGTALFLNSPVGRYADEWVTDLFVRAYEELRARLIVATLQWILDIFQRLLAGLSRLLHSLDEWSRFRVRDRQSVKFFKLIGGIIWSVASYFIILASTLFIEPQVNPVKHFPVVTVSHKLIIPFGPSLVKMLSPYMAESTANLIVWSTIWLIPGVFGFLVWELKENWRLYAANRAKHLKPLPVGHHGETVVGLLRPSFHSGTVPKKFARLRSAQRQLRPVSYWKSANRQQAELEHVETAVKRFVERDLLALLAEAKVNSRTGLQLSDVRLATNNIQAVLTRPDQPDAGLRIVWCEQHGVLTARVEDQAALRNASPEDREAWEYAIAGLCQRAGADRMEGDLQSRRRPIPWEEWVSRWDAESRVRSYAEVPATERVAD